MTDVEERFSHGGHGLEDAVLGPTRWTDDVIMVVESGWLRSAVDHPLRKSMGEAYAQQ